MTGSGRKKRRRTLIQAALEDAAIRELMVQPTLDAASKAAGVDQSTIRRWFAKPAFRRRLNAARKMALDATVRVLEGHSAGALSVIHGLMASKNESIRLRAAELWLNQRRAHTSLCDQQEQIEELRKQVDALKQQESRR